MTDEQIQARIDRQTEWEMTIPLILFAFGVVACILLTVFLYEGLVRANVMPQAIIDLVKVPSSNNNAPPVNVRVFEETIFVPATVDGGLPKPDLMLADYSVDKPNDNDNVIVDTKEMAGDSYDSKDMKEIIS